MSHQQKTFKIKIVPFRQIHPSIMGSELNQIVNLLIYALQPVILKKPLFSTVISTQLGVLLQKSKYSLYNKITQANLKRDLAVQHCFLKILKY